MVATGFLSLNVHEALHFDGTPLCLHPDLLVSSDSASHTTTFLAGNLPPRGKDDKGASSHSEKHEKPIPQVGDLLEIRVWDPLNAHSSASNVASILRPRGSLESVGISANSSASTAEVRSSSVTMAKPPPPLEPTESATVDSSDAPLPELVSSSQQPSPSAQTAKSVVAPSPALAKPPMQRRVTAPLPDRPRPKAAVSSKTHVRDVSEMTVDSVVYASSVDSHPSDTEKLDEAPPGGDHGEEEDEDEEDWSATHQLRLSFIMVVSEKTWTSLKGSARTQVSLLRSVADLYQLSAYDTVTIHTISPDDQAAVAQAVAIDFLLVTIKDQFISRGDMHYFQQCLLGSWVYQGQRLYEPTRGFQANAREIRRRDAAQALSGIVTESTVITFRSRSTRIIWLVQMSSEMWDYGPYDRGDSEEGRVCEIYFDRWIAFIHKLFTKWKELEASHSLTVIFFDRTFLGGNSKKNASRDVYGRYYEDHFRIVLENETCPDWHSLIVQIKKAFVRYPLEVGWTLTYDDTSRRPSTASHGNVLEAINVTLNLLQFHYLDRDLQRTGNSIVIVSAGNGVFEVDRNLAGITYQVSAMSFLQVPVRGIGISVVFLSLAYDG
jgi:Vacuolar membrane-associated protein Iml1